MPRRAALTQRVEPASLVNAWGKKDGEGGGKKKHTHTTQTNPQEKKIKKNLQPSPNKPWLQKLRKYFYCSRRRREETSPARDRRVQACALYKKNKRGGEGIEGGMGDEGGRRGGRTESSTEE